MKTYAANDWVVHHQTTASVRPERDAREVWPAARGELYRYIVDHVYRVVRVLADGSIEAVGRDGVVRLFDAADPSLEKAGWWRRWRLRRGFPQP